MNSIEKQKTKYANSNMECTDYSGHNRLLFLLPHTYNDALKEKVLEDYLEDEEKVKSEFDPGKFLKEKIIDNISSIQTLIYGNTSEESSVEFCKKNILGKFNTVNCYHTTPGCLL